MPAAEKAPCGLRLLLAEVTRAEATLSNVTPADGIAISTEI
jgi:hypothetical protein